MDGWTARFERQARFAPLGPEGQARLEGSRVLVVGCGALGGALAQTLARCGIGRMVLVDRDVVDVTNLSRQVLFEDRHLGLPKVDAALEALGRIGGPTRAEGHAVHLDAENLPGLAAGCDLVLDGTDNLSTRYLLNDFSVEQGVPWVYGGVVGGSGIVLLVNPRRGACLRCLFPDPPAPGSLETCETAGVILPAVAAVAAFQAGAALRWLASDERGRAAFEPRLVEVDPWDGSARHLALPPDPDCPACARGELSFLRAPARRSAVSLCGRNTVQVRPSRPATASGGRADLERMARAIARTAGGVRHLGTILRFEVEGLSVTVFADGRALVEGTADTDRARAVYDRYVGS